MRYCEKNIESGRMEWRDKRDGMEYDRRMVKIQKIR